MKKVIFLSLIIFLLGFYLIPNKAFAENKIGTCGGGCNYSYGQPIDTKEYKDGATVCPKDCPKCQPKEYSEYYNYSVCTAEDYEPGISDLGGETLRQGLDEKKAAAQEQKTVSQEESFKSLTDKVNQIIPYAVGLGGLIAFFLMIFGGLQIILSGGNPEKVKAGKEIITSAIAGLLLIIFSVFILRLIGVNLLNLPGFGE